MTMSTYVVDVCTNVIKQKQKIKNQMYVAYIIIVSKFTYILNREMQLWY